MTENSTNLENPEQSSHGQFLPSIQASLTPKPKPSSEKASGVGRKAVMLVLSVLFFGAIYFYLFSFRPSLQQKASSLRLKNIGIAIHNYHDTYRQLPLATISDRDGVAYRSWRSSVLPFMGRQANFAQLDQKKPWNDPANLEAANSLPNRLVYHSPSDSGPDGDTSYVAIIGKSAFFAPPEHSNQNRTFGHIKDGLAFTIMVIEVQKSGVPWNQPGDMTIDEAVAAIKNSRLKSTNCLFADGTVRSVPRNIPEDVLRSMMDISDSVNSKRGDRK